MGFVRGSGSGDLPKTASLESTTWKPRLLNLVGTERFMTYKISDTHPFNRRRDAEALKPKGLETMLRTDHLGFAQVAYLLDLSTKR